MERRGGRSLLSVGPGIRIEKVLVPLTTYTYIQPVTGCHSRVAYHVRGEAEERTRRVYRSH